MAIPGKTLQLDGDDYNIDDIKSMKKQSTTTNNNDKDEMARLAEENKKMKTYIRTLEATNERLVEENHRYTGLVNLAQKAYGDAFNSVKKHADDMKAAGFGASPKKQ